MRFFALVLILPIVFIVAICGTILVGQREPDATIALFTNPDGSRCKMPCLLGIRPGETTFVDAIAMVKAHPLTSNLQLFTHADYSPSTSTLFSDNRAFTIDDTVFFAGQSGQIIIFQLQTEYQDCHSPLAKVWSVRLSSFIDAAAPKLPSVKPALEQIWHEATFEQVAASIGPPENLSFPTIMYKAVWSGPTYFESFYYDNRLVFTHSSTDYKPYFGNNAFGSVSVYATDKSGDWYRFNTGYQHRVGATLPWLGLVSPRKYYSWLLEQGYGN